MKECVCGVMMVMSDDGGDRCVFALLVNVLYSSQPFSL